MLDDEATRARIARDDEARRAKKAKKPDFAKGVKALFKDAAGRGGKGGMKTTHAGYKEAAKNPRKVL